MALDTTFAFPMKTITLLLCSLLLAGCYHSQEADVVVHNAIIHSLDGSGTTYQAMAIRDGHIVELGAERQILNRYATNNKFDAAGQVVYPGFIDGHCHFLGYGLNKQKLDLQGVKWIDELLDRVTVYAEAHPEKKWIIGRGWDQNLWPMKVYPDNVELNRRFPDRPVLLQRVDGHAALVNDAALREAGLDVTKPIDGGQALMTNGTFTGILLDNAVSVFQTIFDQADEQTKRTALLRAQEDCFAVGLTMVCDAGLDVGSIELIQKMQAEGTLKMRIYAMVADAKENLEHFARSGPLQEDRLVVRSVKVYGDGALGSRGALLKAPYSDQPGHFGLQLSTREHFLEIANWCNEHGFQMNTHCIGDSANALLLGVYSEVLKGTNDKRWRIEHAQVLDPKDMPLFGAYSIIPSVQPTHATSDGPWAEDRVGPERIKHAYAYDELLKTMGMLALGTDFPVEGIDPLQTFRSAVFRVDADGKPIGGYHPEHALTAAQALNGMTIWNAIASFTENDLGTLEAGKKADFVVLDRDLLKVDAEHAKKARVKATFVGGEKVF